MREVVMRIVDDSDFLDFEALYGPATMTGHAAIDGHPVGIVTNNGPFDPEGTSKVTDFIQSCCQSATPLVYLQNTTGYMVGKAQERSSMIKHGSEIIQICTPGPRANQANRRKLTLTSVPAPSDRTPGSASCR